MKPRRWTVDLPLDLEDPPQPGDLLVTPRTVYRVIEARPVESRQWENRWRVTVRRDRQRAKHEIACDGCDGFDGLLGPFLEPDRRWWPVTPYRKGEPRPWEKVSSDT